MLVFSAAIFWLATVVQQVPGLLVERRLADELGVQVGDTVHAAPLTGGRARFPFRVEGIHERQADPNRISRNEYEVRFHLPNLEALLGLHDRVDRFALVLEPDADPAAVSEWIEGLAFGTQVVGAEELAEDASATFQVVSRFHDAIGLITMLASGIFLLCLMVIRVDERRPDVRTMRLVGISRRTIFLTVVVEAVTIAVLATFVGTLLGGAMTVLVNAYYANFYDTTLRFAVLTPQIVLIAAGTGILLGVVAGALAALRIVRLSPQRLGER